MTAAAHTPVRAWDRWIDRVAGSDPGFNRLRAALQSVLTIGIILAAEWLFVHYTHALQIQTHGVKLPAAAAAEVALANHAFLVIAMVVGAIVGMLASVGVTDTTARGQLITTLFLPLPMIGAIALGITLGGHRVLSLTLFAVILTIGTYCRRFGPRGFLGGIVLFLGDFLGFFLTGTIALHDLGWVAAEIGVGLAVTLVVRFALFYPSRARAVERTQRSYAARARKVAALALELLDNPGQPEQDVRRLHRQLVRLNEAALMIDAQIGDPGAVADGSSAQLLHQRLFDAELALTNIARFAQAMARFELPASQHLQARLALRNLVRGENQSAKEHADRLTSSLRKAGPVPDGQDRAALVVVHRFAGSVIILADAMTEWMAVGATDAGHDAFQPAVRLFGGWLPGSAVVSSAASLGPGSRIRLALYTRTAIQIGIAVGAATALGDLRSGHRFYWAVIGAFVTFTAANNAGEQVRKAFFRVAGTVAGVAVGSLLVTAVGHHTAWSIVVILAALFFAFYLNRINYAFMVMGVTVMVSQVYVQLGEFSHSLLLLRLEETAMGAAVGIAVVMLVLPLRTHQVLRVAVRVQVQAIGGLVGHACDHLLGENQDTGATLRSDARAVDAAYQALETTARPVRRNLSGAVNQDISRALRLASAARHYSRNLVADTGTAGPLDAGTRLDIELAAATLRQSLDTVAAALAGPRDGVYTRSAALFDQAERRIEERSGTAGPAQLVIRDLKLIDGTMARLAEDIGLTITDYDTTPAAPAGTCSARIRGRVSGPDGAGIPAAITLIDPRGQQAARAAAGPDGVYCLDAPAPGAYILLTSAEFHQPAASTVIVPQQANGSGTVVNVLLAGVSSRLTGTVAAGVSGHTRPVCGARVTLLDSAGDVVAVAGTDEAGQYAIEGLCDGEYTAIASGYPPAASTLHITGVESTVRHDVELKHTRADILPNVHPNGHPKHPRGRHDAARG